MKNRFFWIFLSLFFLNCYLLFSQTVIRDTIRFYPQNKSYSINQTIQNESISIESSFEIRMFISTTSGIFHPSPRKILLTIDTTYVIDDCNPCGVPSNGYYKTVTRRSSSVKIDYTGSVNAPTVTLRKQPSTSIGIENYDLLFNYPPNLGIAKDLVAGYVIVTNNAYNVTMQPNWDSCFSQVDPRWKGKRYDSAIKTKNVKDSTINGLGCSLSNMATVLSAVGMVVNPDSLNNWLLKNTGFSGNSVKWDVISNYPGNNSIRVGGKIGSGIVKTKNNTLDTVNSQPLSFQLIDSHLIKNQPIIAQVASLRSDGTSVGAHWVVIVGKDNTKSGSDAYKIYDPGSNINCSNRTLALPKYLGGKIYRYIYFVPKN